MGRDVPAEEYDLASIAIPTRDSMTVTLEDDGGFSFHVTMKAATLARLRRDYPKELASIASTLLAMKGELDEAPKKGRAS